MTPSRRRRQADRSRKSKTEPAELPELPEPEGFDELEPVDEDELDSLEPVEEEHPGVNVRGSAADEAHFDTLIEIEVAEMEKDSVPDAIEGPLRRQLGELRAEVRHRRVLVRFTGDAMIGSAAKERAGAVLAEHKVLAGTVRRGFGDEVVHEGALPEVSLETRQDGDTVQVLIRGEVDPEDLSMALAPELDGLCADAADRSFEFEFEGVESGPATHEQIRQAMAEAGARRSKISGELLFDRELEARVRVAGDSGSKKIEISQADDEEQTLAALDLVLGNVDFAGQRVLCAVAGGSVSGAVLDRLRALCSRSGPEQVALDRGSDEADILVPSMLQVADGRGGVVLRVDAGGRGRSAMLAAFHREAAALRDRIKGSEVTVDWPDGFVIDAEIERSCLHEALADASPRSVHCTVAGDQREPFVPLPVTFGAEANVRKMQVDVDAAKPNELVRALERRMAKAAEDLKGQPLHVAFVGDGIASRSVQRTVLELANQAAVSRLEIQEHDATDVLLPELLQIETNAGAVRIAVDAAGRDEAQVERSLQRELSAAELSPAQEVTVVTAPLANQVIEAVVASGSARVLLAGDELVQVHPALFSSVTRDGERIEMVAAPGSDGAMVSAQLEHEMSRILAEQGSLSGVEVVLTWPGGRAEHVDSAEVALQKIIAAQPERVLFDDGEKGPRQVFPEVVPEYVTVLGVADNVDPPIAMLGIAVGGDSEERDKVMEACQGHAELLTGRRVLLTAREDGRDRPVRDQDATITAVRGLVDPLSAATLVFRGADAQRRRFFEVVHSSVDSLKVGARVGDPRPSA